jgi:hypothetical protein
MDVIVERAAALDVHEAQVTACVRLPGEDGERRFEVREFSTVVGGLLVLRDWLKAHGVTKVAMEATSVYWKPVWAVLEDDFELLLVNPRHVKNLPGRKTDVKDAEWLCQLLGTARGLSFNEDKTRVVTLTDGFDFLGFNLRRYRGKLLIKPSKAAIRRTCKRADRDVTGFARDAGKTTHGVEMRAVRQTQGAASLPAAIDASLPLGSACRRLVGRSRRRSPRRGRCLLVVG